MSVREPQLKVPLTDKQRDAQGDLLKDTGSWSGACRDEFISGWQRWLSFACIWLWTCLEWRAGLESGILSRSNGILENPIVLMLFATVIVLIFIVLLSKDNTTIVGSRPCMIGSGAALCGGAICITVSVYINNGILFLAGGILGGLAIGFLKVAWGEMYSRMSLRSGLIDIGFAIAASSLAFVVLLFTPSIAQIIALIASSVFCAPLAWYGTHRLNDHPVPTSLPGDARSIHFSWTLLILPILVGLTYGLIMGIPVLQEVDDTSFIRVGMTVADLLAGLFLIIASRFLSMRFGASQIYSVGIIGTAASLILALIGAIPAWIVATVSEIGFAAFYFFMVVYWGNLARRVNRPLVFVYSLGYMSILAAMLIGLLIGYAIDLSLDQAVTAFLFAALALALFVVVLLVFGNSGSSLHQWLVVGEPAEMTDEISDACAALTNQYVLTPREHEVLILLARGRTAAYIGRTLGITSDTAKVHIRNIYRKIDIHTQQELIDMIMGPTDNIQ